MSGAPVSESRRPPPRGWQLPGRPEPPPSEMQALLELLPLDTRERLQEAWVEFSGALRELTDWCLERLEGPAGGR